MARIVVRFLLGLAFVMAVTPARAEGATLYGSDVLSTRPPPESASPIFP